MHKLSVEAPPKILVERYLIEIAKNYNVPYEPDAMVHVRFRSPFHLVLRMMSCVLFDYRHIVLLSQPEVCSGEEADLIDVNADRKNGGGGGGGGGGFCAPPAAAMPMAMPMPMPMPMPTPFNYPPPKGAVRKNFNSVSNCLVMTCFDEKYFAGL